MSVRFVRLGTPRAATEGTRIGAVRRPPRGVRKQDYASADWFDVWYPDLAPGAPLVAKALAADSPAAWRSFARAFRAEMAAPAPRRTIELLAALSARADFSLGCYCADENRCHRSVLRELFAEAGADIAEPGA